MYLVDILCRTLQSLGIFLVMKTRLDQFLFELLPFSCQACCQTSTRYITFHRVADTLGAEMFGVGDFWLETLIFMGMKQKKIQNGHLKKSEFFKIDNSQYFFVKILGIGPWVSRID